MLRAAGWGLLLPAIARGAEEPPQEELRTQLLRTGLFLVSGGGANTLVRLTPRGLVLVDAKREASFKPLMAQVRRVNRLADLPLRLVVLTSDEEDHSGGAGRFEAAGAKVLLPSPTADDREMEIGGAPVLLLQVGRARGPRHAVVHFPDLRVTAVGSLYEDGEDGEDGAPESLLREGGSLAGWASALDRVLQLELGLVVAAHGPPIARAQVEALRSKLRASVSSATLKG
jgi:glyoxylase-like metal-dependent hydrolase (beta-lactamase superfamily II)